jgi:uncharacterized protein YjbI with pentapeptide repeats
MALDFSNQDLRGKSFKNQDLSGANFSNVKCGQPWWAKLGLFFIHIVLGLVAGFSIAISELLFVGFANNWNNIKQLSEHFWLIFGLIHSFLFVGCIWMIWRNQAINLIWITSIIVVVIVVISGAGAGTVVSSIIGVVISVVAAAGAIAMAEESAISGAIIGMFFSIISGAITGAVIDALPSAGARVEGTAVAAVGVIIALRIMVETEVPLALAGAIAAILGSTIIFILTGYIAWCTRSEDLQFLGLRQLSLWLNSLGGTNFKKTHLNQIGFYQVNLKYSRFYKAKLERINWRDCKNLKFAYLKGTILEIPIVRDLLVSGNGQNQSFVGLNLTGAYLKDANLENADFTDADLTNADLRNANLCGAKLIRANLLKADLSGANLTGTYLENWNIDDKTILENIEADYVYLYDKQRQPPTGIFKKGEFSKLFQQVTKTLDFIVENRLELDALLRAAQKLKEQVPDLEVQSIERKQDSAVVKLTASPEFDREQLYAEIKHLQAMIKLAIKPIININVENKAMIDNSRHLNISNSTLTGNTLNLGKISGQVQNSIQQLPATNPEQNQLKETLSKLQQWVEKLPEKAAKPEDKADVLQHIEKIADISQQPKDQQDQGIIRTALKVFKGFKSDVDETISDSKTLLTEFDDLVAQIKSLFP